MTEAPRWRLTEPHYINLLELPDGTKVEWEHKETNRENGRTVRKLYPVPMLLDPKSPADCNYPGEIIVSQQVDGVPSRQQDYLFVGCPTQGMEPMNEEAQRLTDAERHRWTNPIETLPVNGGMSGEESAFMAKMMEAFAKVAPVETQSVPKADYDELKSRLERIESAIASGASLADAAKSEGARRL